MRILSVVERVGVDMWVRCGCSACFSFVTGSSTATHMSRRKTAALGSWRQRQPGRASETIPNPPPQLEHGGRDGSASSTIESGKEAARRARG